MHFVIETALFAFNCALFTVFRRLLSGSAYMTQSPWACFDPGKTSLFYIVSGIGSLLTEWYLIAEQWLHIPTIAVHIAVCVWVLYSHCVGGTYLHPAATKVAIGFTFSAIICDLVHFVIQVRGAIRPDFVIHSFYSDVIAALVSLVAGLIVGHFWVDGKTHVMKSALSYDGEVPSSGELEGRYRELGLGTSERKARAYLQVGLANGCDAFLDWSLWKFVVTQHAKSNDVQRFCLQLVMYFPSEYRQAGALSLSLSRVRESDYVTRFLLMQVEKIRVVRQSSSNAAAAERLREIRELRDRIVQQQGEIWAAAEGFYPKFLRLDWSLATVKAKCQEIAGDYPNSMPHAEALLDFYVEGATDFSAAILQRRRMDLLEQGKSFATDHCFRGMVRQLPLYLKNGILSVKGQRLDQNAREVVSITGSGKKPSSSASASVGASTETTLTSGMDPAVEEAIGKSLLTSWRTRVAVQKCLEERKMSSATVATLAQVLLAVVSLGVGLVMFLAFRDIFDKHQGELFQQRTQAEAHGRLVTSALQHMLANADHMQRLSLSWPMMAPLDEEGELDHVTGAFSESAQAYAIDAELDFRDFLADVAQMRSDGADVREHFPMVFEPTYPFTTCHEGKPIAGTRMTTIPNLFAFAVVNLVSLRGGDETNWWRSDEFCEMRNVMPALADGMLGLRTASTELTESGVLADQRMIKILTIAIPTGSGVVLIGLSLLVLVPGVRELSLFGQCASTVPEAAKERACAPIRIGGDSRATTAAGTRATRFEPVTIILYVLLVLAILGQVALLLSACIEMRDTNRVVEAICDHLHDVHVLEPVLLELAGSLVTIELLSGSHGLTRSGAPFGAPSSTSGTTLAFERSRAQALLEFARDAIESLSRGDGRSPLLGQDDETDGYLLRDQCDRNPANPSVHETYRCSGLFAQAQLILEFVSALLQTPTFGGLVADEVTVNLLHALSYHFMPLSSAVWARLGDTMPSDRLAEYSAKHAQYFIGEVVLMVVAIVVARVLRLVMEWAHEGIKTSVRRLAPEAIMLHTPLLHYILNIEDKGREFSTTRQIINNSGDGIIAVDKTLLIESVNQGTQKILGFNPEQLLGQDLRLIFTADDGERILRHSQMMIRREASKSFTSAMTCVGEDELEVPAVVTLLGLTPHRQRDISNFVVMVKDARELQAQRTAAANAKARSEELLYQILPRDIVQRLNAGERDISFVVQCATLVFIDIQSFSDYAANLPPQQTLHNLSTIFQGYDAVITKYPLCLKMKFVGDVYMMAAGLFAPGIEPEKHADESVRFAIDCLGVIDDSNHKLDASLAVRIGINTGGPLTAGVLGADKPLFDILGDPINVAARLQSTAPPGKVQISEATQSFIRGSPDLVIEPRGEVMLKGKGMRPAFLVTRRAPEPLPSVVPASSTVFGAIIALPGQGSSKRRVLTNRESSNAIIPPAPYDLAALFGVG